MSHAPERTKSLPPDPIEGIGLAGFADGLRSGRLSAEKATAAYLERIQALDSALKAFEHITEAEPLECARSIDRQLRAGIDLGPLMGVPVAVKDVFAVKTMPTKAGARIAVNAFVGGEGAFVGALRRNGCVILGKTRTTEFALGRGGVNPHGPTPRNPRDPVTVRLPGGSSSGSAVAVAAGLCAFAVGTDTGGSARLPAAWCGIYGLRATVGRWPLDGAFPLAPALDAIGILARSAGDVALAFAALSGTNPPAACRPRGLRLGRPRKGYEALSGAVAEAFERACDELVRRDVEIAEVELPDLGAIAEMHEQMLAVGLLALLGRRRVAKERHLLDPANVERIAPWTHLGPADRRRLAARHRDLCEEASRIMCGLDALIMPTASDVAVSTAEATGPNGAAALRRALGRNVLLASWLGGCAASCPISGGPYALPVGLEVQCLAGSEAKLLSVALCLEAILGALPPPDLSPFLCAINRN